MLRKGRFSRYIRPLLYLFDLCIIYVLALLILLPHIHSIKFGVYIVVAWSCLSLAVHFYEVYRFTHIIDLIILIAKQAVLFALASFAYFGYYVSTDLHTILIWKYILLSIFFVTLGKFFLFYILKSYRLYFKGNHRRVIILGESVKIKQLENFFNTKREYGYDLYKVFDIKEGKNLEKLFEYTLEYSIEEIYVSLEKVSNSYIQELIKFADNNLIVLKFLPDTSSIFFYKLKKEYYNLLPILSIRQIPIEEPLNKLLKRIFDVFVSLLVLVAICLWLFPILAIIIKLDSPGPVFFKQKRIGLRYKEFTCYKFRSMHKNIASDLIQATKNDKRTTRFGKILRKTSIDELPQFINVLLGEMSIVGPRPLMVSLTHMYAEQVDKFMLRYFVKPGITGLAQVSGFRGEMKTQEDILNRVKYDVFYLENWSLFLDIKIILLTAYNIIRGEDKAY